ncbi:MAG TPA: CHAD domain-containing protein [Candidatus Solibacter sp.]|nr:CHAD domain-containing protein [Candidatus Solibacter sp.]
MFRKVERDLLRLAANQEPESVHGFRTTTRRFQTLIEEILPERNRNQKKLLKLLGTIRKRAGRVRDLDVQLAALRSLKIPQEPRRKTQLTSRMIELRAQHEKKLRKELGLDDVKDIRKRLKRAAKEIDFNAGNSPLVVARDILDRVQHSGSQITEDVLHQYRILVKRARYAAEFAADSAEARRFIAQLKKLQDAVGNWHDWLTLTETAGDRFGDIRQSPLVAALHNVTGAKFRQAVAAISAAPAMASKHKAASPIATPATLSTPKSATNPQPASQTDSAA